MITLRKYASLAAAEMAALRLRDGGIPATVVGHYNQLVFHGTPLLGYDLVIPGEADRADAQRLLEELHEELLTGGDGERENELAVQALADLSRLDPERFPIACPACGEDLGAAIDAGVCPACAESFDGAELVLALYGPEALAECCDASAADDAGPNCAGCGADLFAAPESGVCPVCGLARDDASDTFGA